MKKIKVTDQNILDKIVDVLTDMEAEDFCQIAQDIFKIKMESVGDGVYEITKAPGYYGIFEELN